MMSLGDWRDKALLGLFTLIMPGIVYMVVTSVNSASKDYVEKEISKAQLTSPYMNDKGTIQQSIDDLYRISGRVHADIEKTREIAAMATQHNYEQFHQLKLEIERLKIRHELYDVSLDIKKKGLGENTSQSGTSPPTHFDPAQYDPERLE